MTIYRLEIKSGIASNDTSLMIHSNYRSSHISRYEYYKDKAKAECRKHEIEAAASTINLVAYLVGVLLDEIEVIE